ncbi:DUF2887 domain-containing protein [Anabaena sp. UHCC 0399]|uniref:DUF2887 domain-containing protein n=1 Tax=Anabaena sp. UHCC 0399 TaxID=3110238 RepID=UPI002B20943A|nr:DUF2887 domain-containing protein [Anabaena sp. UHCC 0399]MEA5565698.1 DUF2887 domain-containing protein [Anabaena sp. UHCC 0399]
MLDSSKVQRVYLNEIEPTSQSLGIDIIKLVVKPEETAPNRARELITKTRQEIADRFSSQAIIDLIETIIVYSFLY